MIVGNPLTVRGGGSNGPDEVYAAISVSYPVGAICTATNGTTTLTAPDTSGSVIFSIPEPASLPEIWTIAAVDGSDNISKTVSITGYGQAETMLISFVPLIVDNASWAQISKVSKAGTGDIYWDIGDCKKVHIQGAIGTRSLNKDLCVFILDFNHPIDKTTADNNIIWGGFKNSLSDSTFVVLCDSALGTAKSDGGKYFNINHWGNASSSPYNTNYGGWKGCDLRYDILGGTETPPSGYGATKTSSTVGYDATQNAISNPVSNTLMAALPRDFREALRLWARYIDSKGNSSTSALNCNSPTIDAISMLSEYEISGNTTLCNTNEASHQKQIAYFTNANDRTCYRDTATTTKSVYWLASPQRTTANGFCRINASGAVEARSSVYGLGIFPVFKT